jgi:hypothetical protein
VRRFRAHDDVERHGGRQRNYRGARRVRDKCAGDRQIVPAPSRYIAFGYVAMLHRPDADIRMADQKVDFSRPVADIPRVKMPGRQVLMTGDRSLTAHIPVGSLGAVYI